MSQVNRNYSYLLDVDGVTVWERLRVIRNFLTERKQALALAELHKRKFEQESESMSVWEREEFLISNSNQEDLIQDCKDEIRFLEVFEKRLSERAELERVGSASDREMYELNFIKEHRERLILKVKSEIVSVGHIQPSTLLSVMKDSDVLNRLIKSGLIREDVKSVLMLGQENLLALTSAIDEEMGIYTHKE